MSGLRWLFSVFGFSLLALSCAAFVAVLARWGAEVGYVSHLLGSKAAVYLGRVSYAIYLIHLPMYLTIQLVIIRWLGQTGNASSLMRAILSGGLATVGAIVFAGLSWRYIEYPILGLKDKLFPTRSTANLLAVEHEIDRSDPLCA